MANQMGRPSKYDENIQKMADEYLYKLEELGHVIPSRAGLCCYIGIAKSTSFEWEKSYPDFSDALRAVEVMQEHMALNGGLSNALNSTIVKLVLTNHGYSDKQELSHSSPDGSMTPIQPTYRIVDE
jgi:hypothetical protein